MEADFSRYGLAALVILIGFLFLWVTNTFILILLYRRISQFISSSSRHNNFDKGDGERSLTPLPLLSEEEETEKMAMPILTNNYIRRSLLVSDQSSSSPDILTSNVYDEISNVTVPTRFLQTTAFAQYRQGSKKRRRADQSGGSQSVPTSANLSRALQSPESHPISNAPLAAHQSRAEDFLGNFVTFKPSRRSKRKTPVDPLREDDEGRPSSGQSTYMNVAERISPNRETSENISNDLSKAEYIPMGAIPLIATKLPALAPKPAMDKVEKILQNRTSRTSAIDKAVSLKVLMANAANSLVANSAAGMSSTVACPADLQVEKIGEDENESSSDMDLNAETNQQTEIKLDSPDHNVYKDNLQFNNIESVGGINRSSHHSSRPSSIVSNESVYPESDTPRDEDISSENIPPNA